MKFTIQCDIWYQGQERSAPGAYVKWNNGVSITLACATLHLFERSRKQQW